MPAQPLRAPAGSLREPAANAPIESHRQLCYTGEDDEYFGCPPGRTLNGAWQVLAECKEGEPHAQAIH